jgi:hypothetical protein
MFQKVSMAGTGSIVLVLSLLFKAFNIDVDDGDLTEVVNAVLVIVGFVLSTVGTFRRTDLKYGFLRK